MLQNLNSYLESTYADLYNNKKFQIIISRLIIFQPFLLYSFFMQILFDFSFY